MNSLPPDATLIFLHIPKNGGTTLRHVIARQYAANQIFLIKNARDESYKKFLALSQEQKKTLKLIQGHFGFGLHERLAQPATYFTLLRNPIERALSHYAYIRRTRQHTHHTTLVEGNLGLEEFVRQGISIVGTDNGQTRVLGGGPNAGEDIPFGGVTRAVLENAKENLRTRFAVVGLVEAFDESILLFQHAFGWKMPWYVNKNVASNRIAPRQLRAEQIALLRESNSLDFELYEFGKELFQQQLAAQPPHFRAKLSLFRALNRRPRLRSLYVSMRSFAPHRF